MADNPTDVDWRAESLVGVVKRALQRGQPSPRTLRAYAGALKRFGEFTGARTAGDLAQLMAAHLQDAIERAFERYSRATVKLSVVAAAKAWRLLAREGRAVGNPFEAIERVKVGDNVPRDRVLRPGELEKVLEAVRRDGDALELACVALLGLHGLRASEALGLRWSDVVDVPEGPVVTVRQKGGREVTVRLKPEAVAALDALASGALREGRVLKRGERPISYSNLFKMITQRTKCAVGRDVPPHGLRATFISEIISRRGIEAARQAARHASIMTTARYSRWAVVDHAG